MTPRRPILDQRLKPWPTTKMVTKPLFQKAGLLRRILGATSG
jgi:hypothetical protein